VLTATLVPTDVLTLTPTDGPATLTSTPVDVDLVPGASSRFSVPALLFVVIGAFLALMLWARQADQKKK
jgi:hypothetical protein